jgi:copper chaperone
MRIELEIRGMTCGHCVAAVKKALAAVPGATVTNVGVGTAVVEADGSPALVKALTDAVDEAGYTAVVH